MHGFFFSVVMASLLLTVYNVICSDVEEAAEIHMH